MDKTIENKLNSLGLTKSESQIYLAVIELGKTSISKIADKTKINRRNIYDAISTLIDKGLIFQIIGEKTGAYAGVDPDKLVELIQSKEIMLETVLPELEKKYKERKIREHAVIYKGVEGFKNYLNDILNAGQDVYCLGAKGGWSCPALGSFADWFEKERIRKKIKVFNLFDQEMKPLISKKPTYNLLGEYRFLPKEYSTNSAVDVFGDRMVTFTGLSPEKFADDVTLFVLASHEVAQTWRTWFKFLWDQSG
ncbi:MAG: helix-turn-helix domain-containing protein [Patescibacteria group bacterium]|jgi:sugar-specific transcriptional regulator TrmB